jgi:hypothetical protein
VDYALGLRARPPGGTELSRILRALVTAAAALAAVPGVAACGSAQPPAGTMTPGTTPSQSPTSLFPSGGIISGLSASPGSSGKPVLVITQLGLQMTFSGQLGTVTYSIDSSQNGSKQDQSGTPFTVNGTIDLATARYSAMACAAGSPIEATITR